MSSNYPPGHARPDLTRQRLPNFWHMGCTGHPHPPRPAPGELHQPGPYGPTGPLGTRIPAWEDSMRRIVGLLAVLSWSFVSIGCATSEGVRYVYQDGDFGVIGMPENSDRWPTHYRRQAEKLMDAHFPEGHEIVRAEEVVEGERTVKLEDSNTAEVAPQLHRPPAERRQARPIGEPHPGRHPQAQGVPDHLPSDRSPREVEGVRRRRRAEPDPVHRPQRGRAQEVREGAAKAGPVDNTL